MHAVDMNACFDCNSIKIFEHITHVLRGELQEFPMSHRLLQMKWNGEISLGFIILYLLP